MNRTYAYVLAAGICLLAAAGCKEKPAEEPEAPPAAATSQTVVMFEGVAPEDEVILKDLLRVDGVLVRGTQYIVNINGQICNVGENLKLTAKTRTYNLQILSISDDSVLVRAVQKQD